jgi:hypothetical protein
VLSWKLEDNIVKLFQPGSQQEIGGIFERVLLKIFAEEAFTKPKLWARLSQ